MKKTYYFIRHATPEVSSKDVEIATFKKAMLGNLDPPLSQTGKAQAIAVTPVVDGLGVDCIISSNLQRAVETASIIASGTGIPYEDRIEELGEFAPGTNNIEKSSLLRFILWSGWPRMVKNRFQMSMYKIIVVYFLVQWRRGKTTGGESYEGIISRIRQSLSALDAHPANRIAVVGHGYWIMFMALLVLGNGKLDFFRLSWVENCSITAIHSNGGGKYELEFFARDHSSRTRS